MNITNLLLSSTAIFTRKISLLQLRSKTAYRLQFVISSLDWCNAVKHSIEQWFMFHSYQCFVSSTSTPIFTRKHSLLQQPRKTAYRLQFPISSSLLQSKHAHKVSVAPTHGLTKTSFKLYNRGWQLQENSNLNLARKITLAAMICKEATCNATWPDDAWYFKDKWYENRSLPRAITSDPFLSFKFDSSSSSRVNFLQEICWHKQHACYSICQRPSSSWYSSGRPSSLQSVG